MKFERFNIQKCCGGFSIVYKIGKPIDINLIKEFESLGFTELKHFTDSGIMYVQDNNFILKGTIGTNRLQLNCRRSNCEDNLPLLEDIFRKIE